MNEYLFLFIELPVDLQCTCMSLHIAYAHLLVVQNVVYIYTCITGQTVLQTGSNLIERGNVSS